MRCCEREMIHRIHHKMDQIKADAWVDREWLECGICERTVELVGGQPDNPPVDSMQPLA